MGLGRVPEVEAGMSRLSSASDICTQVAGLVASGFVENIMLILSPELLIHSSEYHLWIPGPKPLKIRIPSLEKVQ
uniref:Uncharacterized protein n=1 Tax=Kalanchoe fedtschenkoi TaxID=63787 RepID=A0A7N0TVS9_KALFE